MSGCTTHRAYLYDRGGRRRIAELFPLTMVRWERVRDDISNASIFMRSPHPSCHQYLAEAEPARHEMVLFRNGERVWEGPLTLTTEIGAQMQIEAKDVIHYLNRTIMRSAYSNAYPRIGVATERLRQIIVREVGRKEALDPPINVLPYLDIRTSDTTAKTSRSTVAYERYVFEELDQMAAKGGIDYTTIGRRIVINDTHENIGEGRTLTEADFGGPLAVSAYGMETCTISAVTDGKGRASRSGGVDPYYGEIELLHTSFEEGESTAASSDITLEEMTTQARRNMSGRYPTPVIVRVPANSTLNSATADELIDKLVPGVRFPVKTTSTYRKVTQVQKLDRVVFEETAKGETIKVSMTPAPGTTPWDNTGETGEEAE